jgi:hypothetical protein
MLILLVFYITCLFLIDTFQNNEKNIVKTDL